MGTMFVGVVPGSGSEAEKAFIARRAAERAMVVDSQSGIVRNLICKARARLHRGGSGPLRNRRPRSRVEEKAGRSGSR